MDRRNAAARQPVYAPGVAIRRSGNAACENTKARRDAFFKAVGLKRTFDQLRWWDEEVRKACR